MKLYKKAQIMHNTTRATRKIGDKTRKNILNAAKILFGKQGFAGTSVQNLADKAQVTKALIYHHYSSKEALWIEVKRSLLSHYSPEEMTLPSPLKGLEAFLQAIIEYKFTAFQNENLVRMIIWQNLEPAAMKKKLFIPSKLSPASWLTQLSALKTLKQLKPHISPEVAMVFISSAISGPFFSSCLEFNHDKSLQRAYKQQLITLLMGALSSIPAKKNSTHSHTETQSV